MYYNTTSEKGQDLDGYIFAAKTQTEFILRIFRKPPKNYTPSQVEHLCREFGKNWPITSVRRSINTLTNQGRLEKTDIKELGTYGRPEYVWKLKGYGE